MRNALVIGICWLTGCRTAPATDSTERSAENLVNVSWGDQILVAMGNAQLDTPEKIFRALKAWQTGVSVQTLLWRMSSIYIQRFYEKRTNTPGFDSAYYKKVAEVESRFDPVRVARQAARVNGQRFLLYMTVYDHGAPTNVLYDGNAPFAWQDRATIEHPEWQTVDRQGRYQYGVLEMAYPESRRLMVDRMRAFVKEFDADGLYVCTRSHSLPALHADQFGFSPPVVQEYQRRYGINILTDPRFDYAAPGFAPDSSEVENWRRLRGEFLVRFYRELRSALPGKTIYTGIPRGRYIGPPYGNMYLDWESLVKERLVDGLVVGVYAGKGLHASLYVPHAKIGYRSSEDDGIAIPAPREAVDQVYAPLCRRQGVKVFFSSTTYERQQRRWFIDDPQIAGFMVNTPAACSGTVAAEHDDALNFPGGQMTVEAFVNPSRLPETQYQTFRILSKYAHIGNDVYRGWEWILDHQGRVSFRVNQAPPGNEYTVQTSASIPTNRWTHLATVYDGARGEIRLYVNGQLDTRRPITHFPLRINREQDLFIGRYGGEDSSNFEGRLDELRLTAEALSFTAPPARPYSGGEPHTVALLHFDELASGSRFPDFAQGQHHDFHLLYGGSEVLVESLPGFGKALRIAP